MDKKLTLKLDKAVIDKAKDYASTHKRSLSRMIESYLKALINKDADKSEKEIKISPYIKSMQTGIKLPKNLDYKREYGDFIEEKYK
jgi:hypothetical protein